MKFSIGHRLFAAVLAAMIGITAIGIGLMRHHVLAGFSNYAVQIELDRLEGLSRKLASQYARTGRWDFLPADMAARRGYIGAELARLQGGPVPPAPPLPPVAPVPPDSPAAPGQPSAPPLPPLPPPPPPPAAHPGLDLESQSLYQRITLFDARQRYLAGRQAEATDTQVRPIVVGGRTVGYLGVAQISRPNDAIGSAFLARIGDSLLWIVAVSVALSALAAILLARHFRAPIAQLAAGASALAEGRYDTRIAVARSDELGQLGAHFNRMAEKLGQMETSRRQWVADSSHELRTPLAVLRAQLEAIEDGVRVADGASIHAMLGQVLSLNKLIDELYTLAQSDTGQLAYTFELLDAAAVLNETAEAFRARAAGAGLALETVPAPASWPVRADRERLRQVFANLLENAIRYTAAPGRIVLSARLEAGQVLLALDDSAPGVPAAALARLGERLYRVEASRSRAHGGAGLGLALCRRVIEAHGGTLAFAHSPLGGLRVMVSLPAAAP